MQCGRALIRFRRAPGPGKEECDLNMWRKLANAASLGLLAVKYTTAPERSKNILSSQLSGTIWMSKLLSQNKASTN